MLQKITITFLLTILIAINSLNIYYYVNAESADVPIFKQLFDKILAEPDLDLTDGTAREAKNIFDSSLDASFNWESFADGDPETFIIDWKQIKKGNQACPERGYGFNLVDEHGNTTCTAIDVCFIQTYAQSGGYSYCTKQGYYLYPAIAGSGKPPYGSMVCCKKWYRR